MKNAATYKLGIGCMALLFCYSMSAQQNKILNSPTSERTISHKRVDNYMELKNLGYTDGEIFEDLANANFLMGNYNNSLFWYTKLKEDHEDGRLTPNQDERFQFAMVQSKVPVGTVIVNDRDWIGDVSKDYSIADTTPDMVKAHTVANTVGKVDEKAINDYFTGNSDGDGKSDMAIDGISAVNAQMYEAPIAVTPDGKTAYFNKAVYVKPLYGIFSKKEMVHKIFRADKVAGQWGNFREVPVCPKYSSALHPTISADGKRLFFASNMPGTYGKYDIYVSTLHGDGSFGVAKNLGEKVNTKKNDLYPNIVGTNTLFFASEGRKGFGGLDVYMVQVERNNVGWSVNLGSPINSADDDFSISLESDNGMGYVMSNRRNGNGQIEKLAFSYPKPKNTSNDKREYNSYEAFNKGLKVDYSTSVYEDE